MENSGKQNVATESMSEKHWLPEPVSGEKPIEQGKIERRTKTALPPGTPIRLESTLKVDKSTP